MELTADEARKIKVPRRWKEVYDLLEKQRDDIVTPVDTMGCEENGLEERRADRGRLRADGKEEDDKEKDKPAEKETVAAKDKAAAKKD